MSKRVIDVYQIESAGREKTSTEPGYAMCSSFCLPTNAAEPPPARVAASNTVGTWMLPRSGRHEFQDSPWAGSSKPESIAACEGRVEACRMVIASSEYEPSLTIAPWTVPCARRRASGRRPSSLMMITWRASGADPVRPQGLAAALTDRWTVELVPPPGPSRPWVLDVVLPA